LRIVLLGNGTILLDCENSVRRVSRGRPNAWLSSHLPSTALPASGPRRSSTTSQPFGSPALSREATARGAEVNASKHAPRSLLRATNSQLRAYFSAFTLV